MNSKGRTQLASAVGIEFALFESVVAALVVVVLVVVLVAATSQRA